MLTQPKQHIQLVTVTTHKPAAEQTTAAVRLAQQGRFPGRASWTLPDRRTGHRHRPMEAACDAWRCSCWSAWRWLAAPGRPIPRRLRPRQRRPPNYHLSSTAGGLEGRALPRARLVCPGDLAGPGPGRVRFPPAVTLARRPAVTGSCHALALDPNQGRACTGVAMRPVRAIISVVFAAAVAVTGCNTHTAADPPSAPPRQMTAAPAPPTTAASPR
jgi:hypothetical protein